MKRKRLPHTLFPLIVLFSLASFAFVNLHANNGSIPCCDKAKMEQPKVEDCDRTESQDIAVPDITVVGRLFDIAKRLIEVAQ